MKLKILSHACLLVTTESGSVIIDPWLVGSCYWRSWWNFPEPEYSAEDVTDVDAIVISHIHWDHWHGPTLRRFFRGKPVFVPDEPGLRSERDLHALGFRAVVRVPHAGTVSVGNIKITMYQFGLNLNDAAVVIEADGVKILNANDAKIAGWALRHLLSNHGRFDFALRSHSSANARVCFKIQGGKLYEGDDREHYFRSFCAFMDVVKPHYAIPFASNHCHLHSDVYEMNNFIANPLQLREYVLRRKAAKQGWKLRVMLPGSSWSSDTGFALRSEACFENLELALAGYRDKVAPQLAAYRRHEIGVTIGDSLMERFLLMLRQKQRRARVHEELTLTIHWPDGRGISRRLSLASMTLREVSFTKRSEPGIPNMIFPADVFRDAVMKNMFHHALISKRCEFIASSETDLSRLEATMGILGGVELGRYPFTWTHAVRLAAAYGRRWRELFVYLHAVWLLKVRRLPIYLAEEAILRGEF